MYTLVLVDDEIWELRDMETLLADAPDFQIIGAYTSAVEAEGVIRQAKPDVVLTDLKMEKMDGMALVSAIRESSPQTRIVICSAYRNFDAARAALTSNVIDYLLKPIHKEELMAVLERARELLRGQSAPIAAAPDFARCRMLALPAPLDGPLRALLDAAPFPCRVAPLPSEPSYALLFYDDAEAAASWCAQLCGRVGFSRESDGTDDRACMQREARVALDAAFCYSASEPVAEVQAYIARNYQSKLVLSTLSEQFHFSSAYLCSLFHKKCGIPLFAFIKKVRVETAARLLATTTNTVRGIAREVGFEDSSHFCRVFKAEKGLTTDAYRQQMNPRPHAPAAPGVAE